MQRFQDYRQLADRSAQLAIASSEPSVKAALMTLAMNYMSASANLSLLAQEEMQQDPSAGYGD
jgi:hypothetical protein